MSLRLGGSLPQIVYSDYGTNILPIHSINDTDEIEELSIKDLKLVLRKNGTELKVSSPSSPWRQGLVESMHKVLKATFRRAQIFKHRLDISDWEDVLANSEHLVNSRPINLGYASVLESLVILTPNKLMFGTKSDLNNPINHGELEGIKLFESLHQLDKQIESWRRTYLDTYIQGAREFSKWQFSNATLSTEDLVT